MFMSRVQKNNTGLFAMLFALFIVVFSICGCGGENSEDGNGGESGEVASGGWDYVSVKQIDARGLLSPHVSVKIGSDNQAYVVYFESTVPEDPEDSVAYTINHVIWDMEDLALHDEEEIILEEVDNCSGLGFSLDSDNFPVVAYQGGELRQCGQEHQSDAMLSIRENDEWDEYVGGIGEVDTDRNPVFTDGLAGADISIAFDSQGDVHLCYQFKYEGCDSMNFAFPDLCYVKKIRSGLSDNVPEEIVEGNYYAGPGTGIQNAVGDHCVITVDNNDEPAIFYYAELPPSQGDTKGLRVARRQGGVWNKEWVEEGCEIGHISAVCDNNGRLAVAYYATQYTDGQGYPHTHCLKYARESGSSSWDIELVDETTLCGDYCSLAFNSSGLPAIAYYSQKSHSGYDLNDLKLVRFNGVSWDREVVHSTGDIGLYNSLWFDSNDRALICSYSNTEKLIYAFFER